MPPFLVHLALAAAVAGAPVEGPRFRRNVDEAAPLRSPDGLAEARMLLDPERIPGLPAYLGQVRLQPGGSVAEHRHDRSAELVYVLAGRGTMILEGMSLDVRAGDAIYIPIGAGHSVRNPGPEDLVGIQLFLPPGPEARFLTWPPAAVR